LLNLVNRQEVSEGRTVAVLSILSADFELIEASRVLYGLPDEAFFNELSETCAPREWALLLSHGTRHFLSLEQYQAAANKVLADDPHDPEIRAFLAEGYLDRLIETQEPAFPPDWIAPLMHSPHPAGRVIGLRAIGFTKLTVTQQFESLLLGLRDPHVDVVKMALRLIRETSAIQVRENLLVAPQAAELLDAVDALRAHADSQIASCAHDKYRWLSAESLGNNESLETRIS